VTAPEITFGLADGRRAAEDADEMQDLDRESGDQAGDAVLFAGPLRVRRRQPGFVLAQARNGGYLVGYAAGMPLRPATSWWKDVTTALPAGLTTEHAGRTFAVTDLLVRPSWRRQGIAASLHDLLLAGRTEERATLVLPPGATAAQQALRAWGWQKIAHTRGPGPDSPVLDMLIIPLPATGGWRG
jgi:GNAT superfamily N-acetyltransferase